MNLRELPSDVIQLLSSLNAPPRLVAHLTLVHDVAVQLTEQIRSRWRDLQFDENAVWFGAASHDIGKVLHPAELIGPGKCHEQDGPALLVRNGFPPELSIFARSHGTWQSESGLTIEECLVALADNCWKGARNEALETRLSSMMANAFGIQTWEAFLVVDEMAAKIAEDGDKRLAWQSQFATTS